MQLAIEIAGGPAALARFITDKFGPPITAQAICDWKKCPPRRAIAVEQATLDKRGVPRVARYRLCPEVYPQQPIPKRRRQQSAIA